MKRIFFGLLGAAAISIAAPVPAQAQSYYDTGGSAVPALVPISPAIGPIFTAAHPGYVQGSFSASFSGFTPTPAYSQLTVGASSARVALPSGTVVIVYNTGSNAAFVQLGDSSVVATSANDVIQPGSWMAFTVGSATYLAALETAGATALNISGGSGLPTGAGGGSGGGGGGGSVPTGSAGSPNASVVTVQGVGGGTDLPVSASALPLPSGAATAALQTTGNTALTTINSTLGSPMQSSGGTVGISGTLPAFASTPTVNLGSLGGGATAALQTTINTTLGSPFQAGGSIGNTAFGISGTLPAFAAIPTFNLGTLGGAATASNQTGGSQKTQIVDGSGSVIGSTSNNLNVQCANCSGSGVSTADGATWTAGSSLFAGVGGAYQTSPTSNPLTAGKQGFAQLTQYRALMGDWYNSSGVEMGTSGSPVRIDPTGTTTQPVSAASLPLPTGAATSANQTSEITDLGTIGTNTAPLTSAQASTTSGQTGPLVQGATTTSAPTYTTAKTNPLSLNTSGGLRVDGSGVTQPVSAASLPLPSGAATSALQSAINTTLGSPFQAGGSIGNTAFGISGTLPAFAATPTFNLGTLGGAATASNQTGGSQKTQIVDGSGSVIGSTSNNLNVQCANCSGSGVSTADGATWTAGSSLFAGVGGAYQASPTSNPLTAGKQGFAQLTQYRALMGDWYNSSGVEMGTSGSPVRMDPTGTTTQPVSAASLPLPSGAATSALQSAINTTLGSPMQNSGGSVTANAGTNLNTSALALESGGNLANIYGVLGTTAATVCAAYNTAGCTQEALLRLLIQEASNGVQGIAAGGATDSDNPLNGGGRAATSEPTAVTNGQKVAQEMTVGGKLVNQPYAIPQNFNDNGGSSTGTGTFTIMAASGSASLHEYMTSMQCGRSDAGTAAITVAISDGTKTRTFVIPNNGGGGGNNMVFPAPIQFALNTAVTAAFSSGVTTGYCNAQGYNAS